MYFKVLWKFHSVLISSDIDECKDISLCDSGTSTCRNTDGSYVCDCNVGYQRDYYYSFRCKGKYIK